MFNEYEEIVTPEEAASMLRIGMNQIYKLLNANSIVAFKEGRTWKIPKSSVVNYIANRCQYSQH